MNDEPNVRYGYMCRTDWDHEIGEGNAAGGTRVYESIEDLKSDRSCVTNCGIVKVKVELTEVIEIGEAPWRTLKG